ncbi:hypothetical protein, conserved in T. vivax, partial [Trypanosoma vivax Y486]
MSSNIDVGTGMLSCSHVCVSVGVVSVSAGRNHRAARPQKARMPPCSDCPVSTARGRTRVGVHERASGSPGRLRDHQAPPPCSQLARRRCRGRAHISGLARAPKASGRNKIRLFPSAMHVCACYFAPVLCWLLDTRASGACRQAQVPSPRHHTFTWRRRRTAPRPQAGRTDIPALSVPDAVGHELPIRRLRGSVRRARRGARWRACADRGTQSKTAGRGKASPALARSEDPAAPGYPRDASPLTSGPNNRRRLSVGSGLPRTSGHISTRRRGTLVHCVAVTEREPSVAEHGRRALGERGSRAVRVHGMSGGSRWQVPLGRLHLRQGRECAARGAVRARKANFRAAHELTCRASYR